MTPIEKLDSIVDFLNEYLSDYPILNKPVPGRLIIIDNSLKELRQMLTSEPEDQTSGVNIRSPRVKELEWGTDRVVEFAKTAIAYYECYYSTIKKKYRATEYGAESSIGFYDTIDLAKAACQAHYEELVLGCLEND